MRKNGCALCKGEHPLYKIVPPEKNSPVLVTFFIRAGAMSLNRVVPTVAKLKIHQISKF